MLRQQGSGGFVVGVEIEGSRRPPEPVLLRLPTIGEFADFRTNIRIFRTGRKLVEQFSEPCQWFFGGLAVGEMFAGFCFPTCQPQGSSEGIPQLGIFVAEHHGSREPLDGRLGMALDEFETAHRLKCGEVAGMRGEPAAEFVTGRVRGTGAGQAVAAADDGLPILRVYR